LGDRLAARIAATGPIGVDDFMHTCLADPEYGYYRTRMAVGAAGDFTTAPEISQIFGELIGLWLADRWQAAGSPAAFRLVELGPGRGVLMQDALRAAGTALPGFVAAAKLGLVEISETMRAAQRERLGGYAPSFAASLDDVPDDAPLFLVANEFFDALPVRQCVKRGAVWCERRVDFRDGGFAFVDGPACPAPPGRDAAPDGVVVETCPLGEAIAGAIAARIAARGGAALIVDYGTAVPGWGDTLQAVRKHAKVPAFDRPGESDLTAHVDFPALLAAAERNGAAAHGVATQAALLTRLGLPVRLGRLMRAAPTRAKALAEASRRLLDPGEMGTLFKAIAIVPRDAPPPPGFLPVREK
jgi:NADH dehydrogenase [ubiquinone] 1 alpha subcomplex assembly factor 7